MSICLRYIVHRRLKKKTALVYDAIRYSRTSMHSYDKREMCATCQFHSPGSSPSDTHPTGTYCTEDCVGPNVDLDAATNRICQEF